MYADRMSHDFEEATGTIDEEADHLETGARDIVRNVDGEVSAIERALDEIDGARDAIGRAADQIREQGKAGEGAAETIAARLREAVSTINEGPGKDTEYDELERKCQRLERIIATLWEARARCPECNVSIPGHNRDCEIGKLLHG
jgi:DNA repair exonuclease SbcCD ATPase subunit